MSDERNTLPNYEAMTNKEVRRRVRQLADVFVHVTPSCDHTFEGWREHSDGRGGEQVCSKCGMGAMAWSLRTGI